MRIWLAAALVVSAAGVSPVASAQEKTQPDWARIASDILHQRLPGDSGNLSKGDVTSGLREALSVSVDLAAKRLAARGGFSGDAAVRIPLPGVLREAQSRLQPFGMAGPLDDLQLKVNRAAEAAAPAAAKLVLDAIKSMTFEDALGVLRGGDHAATDLLRSRTETNLRETFRPYIDEALKGSGALAAVDGVLARYGEGRVRTNAKTWLADNATSGALDGLFYYVAREEQAIRRDPVKRTSDLLRKVFGG